MVLTITVVGNSQADGNSHAVLSPNELAQFMSGQTVTGLLNPDGSITLNSNIVPTQQLTSMPASVQNGGSAPITSSAGATQYPSRLQMDQLSVSSTNSISNIQAITTINDSTNAPSVAQTANNHSQANQKKTGQKRRTTKQKQALQQQQQQQIQQQQMQQQMQSPETRQIMTPQSDQPSISQQPQIVATVQLPNGQIGQLIAPSGGQYWSPNAINLQQLSMAVAAATGTMPQTLSLPAGSLAQSSTEQQPQQVDSPSIQQQSQHQQQSPTQQQPLNNNSNNNPNGGQHVMTTVQLPNNQIGQVGRPGQGQIWSGNPISLSQLSALAQQGVVQLSPVQVPTTGPNGQRVMEVIPQAAIQGLLNQNSQSIHTMPLPGGNQLITQDSDDPGRWQIVSSAQNQQQQQAQSSDLHQQQSSSSNNNQANISRQAGGSFCGTGQYNINNNSNNSITQNSVLNESTQPGTQRKLKRLACTCPNCRDGDNSRSGSDKKKQHICHFPECNKVYGKTSHLRAHLRWHSGERPYVCNWSFCGKKFTRSDELQRHRRTHTGEKRFQCSECLKRFMRSDHLSKHLKTHLSSKKCNSSQQQQQAANGIPTIVTLPQNPVSVKSEPHNMIDELALDTLDESNDQQQSGLDMVHSGPDVNS